MAVNVAWCLCVGPLDFNCLSGLPTPSGLIGAGKIESRKVSVEPPPDMEELTACTDTLEPTEKYLAVWSTGVLLGHAGHEEGGHSIEVACCKLHLATSSDEAEKVYLDAPNAPS